jgi:carboxyl-terminal processing protease
LRVSLEDAGVVSIAMPDSSDRWGRLFHRIIENALLKSKPLQDADDEKLYEAIFTGISKKLDRFSRYAGAKQAEINRVKRQGYGGIGIHIRRHPMGALVTKLTPGLPAAKAGLRAGDLVVAIGNTEIAGFSPAAVRHLIRGPVNVPLSVRYRRGGSEAKRVLMDRERIVEDTVFASYRNKIAFIRITGFNTNTAHSLETVIGKLRRRQKKMRGVVLDLRNNPGGLLDQAVAAADLFLESGGIVSTAGRHKNSMQYFRARPGDILGGMPIAILVNGKTASAAEILAAALQDNGRAIVIGSSSFGKGTVQTVLPLPNNGEFVLTWALFKAPSGYPLQNIGVLPTICTAGSTNAATTVGQFQKGGAQLSQARMTLRRKANYRSRSDRHRIRAFCPGRTTRILGLDRQVAEMMLNGTDRYSRAVKTARSMPGK